MSAIEECVEHLPVVLVQPGAVGVIDVHHHLDGFGDVPSRFEHVHEAVAFRDGRVRPMWNCAALSVIGLRIILLYSNFQ